MALPSYLLSLIFGPSREKRDRQAKYASYKSAKAKSGGTTASSKSSGKSSNKSSNKSGSKSGSGSSGSSGSGKTTSNAVVEDVTANAIKSQKLEPVVNKANDYTPHWDTSDMGDSYITGDVPNFRIFISHQKYDALGTNESTSPDDVPVSEEEGSTT